MQIKIKPNFKLRKIELLHKRKRYNFHQFVNKAMMQHKCFWPRIEPVSEEVRKVATHLYYLLPG